MNDSNQWFSNECKHTLGVCKSALRDTQFFEYLYNEILMLKCNNYRHIS